MSEAPLIIRGGQAVSPREVERVLLSHPAVTEAAVAGLPGQFRDEEIVAAAVRLAAPLPSPAADLAGYCRARLAGYKVPDRWLFTGALPRTPAGGLCRATLIAQLAVAPLTLSPAAPLRGPFPQRAAIEDLRIPRQVRRSRALEDLDYL
jgi:acyl-CoA synthetase (AMP-forming)/AMP-acid ligase II